MRRFVLALVFIAITFATSGFAQAGLLSLISAAPNNTNDQLQDRSWANTYTYDSGGVGVTEVYGLARIDRINNVDYTPSDSVWMVYSFRVKGNFTYDSNQHPQYLFQYNGWLAHEAPREKTIDSLLGVNGTGSGAMVALVELNSSPSQTDPATDALASLRDDNPADLGAAFEELHSLISNGQAKWIASFGIVNSYDVVLVGSFTNHQADELIALSIVATNGANINDFKPLFSVQSIDPVFYPNYEFASFRFITVTDQGVGGQYTDQGTVIVNYVPEPSSVLGLIGVGLSGVGVHLARRRRK